MWLMELSDIVNALRSTGLVTKFEALLKGASSGDAIMTQELAGCIVDSMEKSNFVGVSSLQDLAKPVFERICGNIVAEGFEPKANFLADAMVALLALFAKDFEFHKVAEYIQIAMALVAKGLESLQNDECSQAARKALLDLGKVFRKLQADKYEHLGSGVVDRIKTGIQKVYEIYTQKNEEVLNERIKAMDDKLGVAMDALRLVAYGGKEVGVAWSKTLKQRSSEADILDAGRSSGLLDIDWASLAKQSIDFQGIMDDWQAAYDAAGRVKPSQTLERASALRLRSHLASFEAELIHVLAATPKDKDAARELISKAVRRFRVGDFREKELLPACICKWAHGLLIAGKIKK